MRKYDSAELDELFDEVHKAFGLFHREYDNMMANYVDLDEDVPSGVIGEMRHAIDDLLHSLTVFDKEFYLNDE